MSNIINRVIYGGIGLVMLFLLSSTLILPQLDGAMDRSCSSITWRCADGGVKTNCTYDMGTNTTSTPTDYPIIETTAGDHVWCSEQCLSCDDSGGFRTTTQGLLLLVIVIGLIGFAVYFMRR